MEPSGYNWYNRDMNESGTKLEWLSNVKYDRYDGEYDGT